ncbi:hypothetical protein [Streptomyces sp. 8N706]|uniref:hypothetical protein n=1 Tax=Streptomyces sp. 8N706 TaxID=3457416 RepID=UPI003FD4B9F6
MTGNSTGADNPPIYEDLVRQCGDVLTEARVAADRAQRQVTEVLNRYDLGHPEHPLE